MEQRASDGTPPRTLSKRGIVGDCSQRAALRKLRVHDKKHPKPDSVKLHDGGDDEEVDEADGEEEEEEAMEDASDPEEDTPSDSPRPVRKRRRA